MDRIRVEEYAATIAELVETRLAGDAVAVPLAKARDRVLADDVASPIDLPPFRNSQMDGYAVRTDQLPPPGEPLRVTGIIAAGETGRLPGGAVVKIMTGAPLPDDADAVVPVEHVEHLPGERIALAGEVRRGDFVRERGSDVRAGTVIVPAGTRLRARHLAAIAAAGLATVAVRERVRVAVISTGRELVAPGDALGTGRIPDANGVALAAAAEADGAEVVYVGRAGDDPAAVARELEAARAAGARIVMTSGGISMGDFEPVRALVEDHSGVVGTVDMQPGGPQAHAVVDGTPLVAFPGNPVSAQVSYALFVSPLLRAAASLPPAARHALPLAEAVRFAPGRRRFLRGRLLGDGSVAVVGGTGSHLVTAMAAADVLVDLPPEVGDLPAGALVDSVEL